MYDVLNFGCIPVVVSDDLVWAFSSLAGKSFIAMSLSRYVAVVRVYQYIKEERKKEKNEERVLIGGIGGIFYFILLD